MDIQAAISRAQNADAWRADDRGPDRRPPSPEGPAAGPAAAASRPPKSTASSVSSLPPGMTEPPSARSSGLKSRAAGVYDLAREARSDEDLIARVLATFFGVGSLPARSRARSPARSPPWSTSLPFIGLAWPLLRRSSSSPLFFAGCRGLGRHSAELGRPDPRPDRHRRGLRPARSPLLSCPPDLGRRWPSPSLSSAFSISSSLCRSGSWKRSPAAGGSWPTTSGRPRGGCSRPPDPARRLRPGDHEDRDHRRRHPSF